MSKNNNGNHSDKDETGEVISWVIVFILLFAFPPVGLLLLLGKMRGYAKPAAKEAKRAAAHAEREVKDAAREVKDAAREIEDAVRQAARETDESVRQAASGAGDAARQAASQYASYAKQTISEVYADIAREFSEPPKTNAKKKKKRSKLEKKSGKFISTVLLLISIVMFILGTSGIASAIQEIMGDGLESWYGLVMGIFYFVGAFVPLFSRSIITRRYSRYKHYYAFVGGRGVVPLSGIAQAAGLPPRTVERDIQAMINSGYFEHGAYIDSELDCLVLSAQAADELRRAVKDEQEAPPQPAEKVENQYMATLNELREINATIADVTISKKVERIGELTAKIFRIVEEKPEKKPQIRRFMSYYLPTTFKLLRSYSTLEKQGVKGENIVAAKQNIGRILDTLVTGYEQQLDQLFKSDALDIAADINVLENLMQQDGLAGDKSGFMTMGGT